MQVVMFLQEAWVVNRAAIILQYKEPAVRRISKADPYADDPGKVIKNVNQERTVYLVSDEDGDGSHAVGRWVKKNYQALFGSELEWRYIESEL
jgi:hypothetical protein